MNAPTRRTVLVYLSATFIVGAVAGSAVGYGFGRRPFFRPFDREAMRVRMCEEFTRELSLTPEQRKQVDSFLRQGMDDVETVHRDHMTRIREVMKQGHDRISAILSPEQRVKYEAMEKQRESRMQARPHRDGSPRK